MAGVWENAPVRSGELLVLLALADHANDSGTCFPSVARLAERARLSLRQTQRVLRHLEEIGLIGREPHGGRRGTDLFEVYTPDIMSPAGRESDAVTHSSRVHHPASSMTQPSDTDDAKGSCEMSPGTVREPSTTTTPIVPKGDDVGEDLDLIGRVKALMKKRPTTPLDRAERKAWATARSAVLATTERDWLMLEAFYAADIREGDYRRQGLATLLNNWNAEVGKAQKWHAEQGLDVSLRPEPTEPEPEGWREVLRRLYPDCYEPKSFAELAKTYPDIAEEVMGATLPAAA